VEHEARCCTGASDIAQAPLGSVWLKLAELRALEGEIAAFVARRNTACVGGPGPACLPLADLARATAEGCGVGTAASTEALGGSAHVTRNALLPLAAAHARVTPRFCTS